MLFFVTPCTFFFFSQLILYALPPLKKIFLDSLDITSSESIVDDGPEDRVGGVESGGVVIHHRHPHVLISLVDRRQNRLDG